MPQGIKAHVVLEFESGKKEAVTIEGMQLLGSWTGRGAGQARPIYEVTHPSVGCVCQHHNVGVAVLDMLRIAIIQLNPDWCNAGPGIVEQLLRPTNPEMTPEMSDRLHIQATNLVGGSS